jgi:hypothetical protein
MQEDTKLEGQEQADKIFRANSSPRFKKLSEYERWVDGRQYDGMPSFWSDDVPLWDRAPCIVYPVAGIAIDSYIDLLLSQSRFPSFTTKPTEDESDEDDGLDPEESQVMDRFLLGWHKKSSFRSASREAVSTAMGTGSAALVFGVRGNAPFNDLIPAKWCEPTLDATGKVLKLVIQYAYQEQYKDPRTKKWSVRTLLYKRVIDDKDDTEYLPGEANEFGAEPAWKVNPDRSVTHGFGFCPVVWYPFMRGCVAVNTVDGKPIQADITDEIRAHDIARSQWHRGALLSEPQLYEIGVPIGYNPTETGVTPRVVTTEHGGTPSPSNPVTGAFIDRGGAGGKSARKRGPGYVYQYPAEAELGAIFYPGDALKAQDDNCRDLRMKLMETLGVVLLDPESMKSIHQLSGKTLEAIKQKQIDRCDKYREDLEERFFGPAIEMQLRIARAVLTKNAKLRVPGATKAKDILVDAKGEDGEWHPPTFRIEWGDYFRPDAAEQAQLTTMVVAALNSAVPFLTVKVAVQKLAPFFGIDNVDAYLDGLKKETDERQQKSADAASAEMRAALSQLKGGDKPNDGEPSAKPGQALPATPGAAPGSKRARPPAPLR